jgi:hypothetical protein
MATLETQYKNFMSENPDSTFTFDEWKKWFGENLVKGIKEFEEREKTKENDKQHRPD